MSTISRLVGALIVTTALTAPSLAWAQDTTPAPVQPPVADDPETSNPAVTGEEEQADVSIPGGNSAIVVTGRINRDPTRSSAQVTSVLSTADIARTGEGDIAGALSRVTGLSVVGGGFVYVRGLGDRYSLALLNGSPLPSPEPLKRVVPLDLFPTSVVSSSLVQKSYSVNFPGEFGGGVINLTTRTAPDDPFLTVGAGISGDTNTTNKYGLTYYGSRTDWLGFDNGARQPGPNAAPIVTTAAPLPVGTASTAIARELVTPNQAVVQSIRHMQPNFSFALSGGTSIPVSDGQIGVIASANYSNSLLTRDAIQQSASAGGLASLENDFRQVSTNQNVLLNGLLALAYEFGDNQTIRLTNVYIHDTIKRASLAEGQKPAQNGTTNFINQRTGFFERQLFDTQIVGEFKFGDLSLDLRGSYANTKRDAPSELFFQYRQAPLSGTTEPALYQLDLSRDIATYGYSTLDEDLYSASADLTYPVLDTLNLTVGGAFSDTQRFSLRREFLFRATGNTITSGGVTVSNPLILQALGTLRPDILLSPAIIDALGVQLNDNDPGTPAFDARLRIWAGYAKIDWVPTDTITVDAGVRYETAEQSVLPVSNTAVGASNIDNDYFLPAVTVTFDLGNSMQARLNASRTIARPQFRELIAQPFYDPDSNRPYRGNPFLQDSELFNAEARFEWYFARQQRLSAAAFYKKIDNPIETFVAGSTDLLTSYANAPSASLYGGEVELTKYFDLSDMGFFFASRQAVVIANYTYTKSQIEVSDDDIVDVFGAPGSPATDYFRDGAPLTGQADHIVNLQLGLEDLDKLSQQTILISYASDRVVSRGLTGSPPQPDVIERPGINVDFVMREGFTLFDRDLEAKFEARNIFGRRYQEFQTDGTTRIDTNTYDLGTVFSLSVSATF